MNDLEMWSGLVAFLLPLVIAVVQQPHFPPILRVIVMVVFCVVAALVTAALQGNLDWNRWYHSVLIIAIGTIAFYSGVWKPALVAPKLERATSTRRNPTKKP